MTVKDITTATNLKTVLAAQNTYFIVKKGIPMLGIQYTVGKGSVIEFAGGYFEGVAGTSINLNGAQVEAELYPIFRKMEVTGLANSRIYAEWFKDDSNTPAHIYINKALRLAKGCPVVLAMKEYQLTGSIVFPSSETSTLIATGTLNIKMEGDFSLSENPVAIDVNVSNVRLNIDKIRFPGKEIPVKDEDGNQLYDDDGNKITKTVPCKGTGVRISGNVYHVKVHVNSILYPQRGIDISLGREGVDAYVQYLDVKFQSIYAEYGINIGAIDKKVSSNYALTRSSIQGGRLLGSNGIYMQENLNSASGTPVSEISFSNIGFEGLTGIPICLRNASRLRFDNLRMAEALPEDSSWIDLQNVSVIRFDIHGELDVDKISADVRCSHIVIKGVFFQQKDSWSLTPFDTLVIDHVWDYKPENKYLFPQKALTSSVNPFPMTNVISQLNNNLQGIQPVILKAGQENPVEIIRVLPRELVIKVNSIVKINLEGLRDYAQCVFNLLVEAGGMLILQCQDGFSIPDSANDSIHLTNSTTVNISKGYYRMMWDFKQQKMKIMVFND